MPRGIDHLVIAAPDLDALAQVYRSLGFTVGARNRHAWGTLNHIVQFPGCFLELLSTEPSFVAPQAEDLVYPFAGYLAKYLERRAGLAMLVLESNDAKADLVAFKAAGIGQPEPFFFERKGKRPDGSDVHVAFTLAFATAAGVRDAGFFVCQQHFPENFWNPAFQEHANGVTGIAAVTLVHYNPKALKSFMSAYTGQSKARSVRPPSGILNASGIDPVDSFAFDTGRGDIECFTHELAEDFYSAGAVNRLDREPHFSIVRFRCRSLDLVRQHLKLHDIPHLERRQKVIVPSLSAFGVTLAFEAAI
jgi:catechol 2,3-dioxygenase-like lactoylglutathione lyase family enzyme